MSRRRILAPPMLPTTRSLGSLFVTDVSPVFMIWADVRARRHFVFGRCSTVAHAPFRSKLPHPVLAHGNRMPTGAADAMGGAGSAASEPHQLDAFFHHVAHLERQALDHPVG